MKWVISDIYMHRCAYPLYSDNYCRIVSWKTDIEYHKYLNCDRLESWLYAVWLDIPYAHFYLVMHHKLGNDTNPIVGKEMNN